jgi:hypothetical protein
MSKDDLFLHTTRLPKKVVDLIERLALDSPWYYSPDCAYSIDVVDKLGLPTYPYFSYGWYTGFINNEHIRQFNLYPWDYFDRAVKPEAYGFSSANKLRAHITLQWPRPEEYGNPHNKHVDRDDNHLVALYYINDSDGDTIFFDGDDVIHREPVERGKLVVFNGQGKYHASSSPSKNIRLTLNVNYGEATP